MTNHSLTLAQSALVLGNTRQGRHLAREALIRAVRAHDTGIEAEAFLVLGQAYLLDSKIHLAHDLTNRAYGLFLRDSNAPGQAEALTVISYSFGAQGKNAEAFEAANAGVALREDVESPRVKASGYNSLGVACLWAKDFVTARDVLEASIWFASEDSQAQPASLQPHVNLCLAETLRITELECTGQGPADLTRLARLVAQGCKIVSAGNAVTLVHGTGDIAFLLLDFFNCFLARRTGNMERAESSFTACIKLAHSLPKNSWLQAFAWWARLEMAAGVGDVQQGLVSAFAMARAARRGEPAQLHALAISLDARLRATLAG